jgi:DNA-directed RNA polymerase specialized sigma24 family protein
VVAGKPSGQSTVVEWLDSPYLQRVASRVAYEYGLPSQEVSDLFQELRLALWLAGPATTVNVTWVFRTAYHKASDAAARLRRATRQTTPVASGGTRGDPDISHLLHSRASRLPDKLRAFYALRYREGLSQREIAARMHLCRSSVRWLDAQCTKLMKGRLRTGSAGSGH